MNNNKKIIINIGSRRKAVVWNAQELYWSEFVEKVSKPIRTQETYVEGFTVGGAVLYENGSFLYSHHETDPAGGTLCNSFDLIRPHKFHEEDNEAKPDTPVHKRLSFAKMCEFAMQDDKVKREKLLADFSINFTPEIDTVWLNELETVRRPRQSIIIGTSNEKESLKDDTGNRRFWPVACGVIKPKKNVFTELAPVVDQMWAEAIMRWKIEGFNYIVQVIPCVKPMVAVYKDELKDSDFEADIFYLGLCADGNVHGLALWSGEFSVVSEDDGFSGLYFKDERDAKND